MELQTQLYPNAAFGNQPAILEAIHQKETSIAIYQRAIQALENDLSVAINKDLTFSTSGTIADISSELETFFAENLSQSHALLHDITAVTKQFDKVANANSYRLLLSTINNNMCRKFHTDINDLRLLCTYVGPGTLWVAETTNNTEKPKGNNKELLIKEDQVHQANTGDVIILKGALYPEGKPAMHRSPTIEEVGSKRLCKRLLLRIDTNEFLGFD